MPAAKPSKVAISTSRKAQQPTMGSYSGTSKFTQTFFYYPTRNPHQNQSLYQSKLALQPVKSFRKKAKAECHSLIHQSSLNPFARNRCHYQQKSKVTGDRKKQVNYYSNKRTDPLTLCFEPKMPHKTVNNTFHSSLQTIQDIQRRNYLPKDRQYSHTNRKYHTQLGFSLSAREKVTPRTGLNTSDRLKTTIQYRENPEINSVCFYDDLRYNSRK